MIGMKRTNSEDKDFQKLVFELDNYLDETDKKAHCICASYNTVDTIKRIGNGEEVAGSHSTV
jgi:hypothetical protein